MESWIGNKDFKTLLFENEEVTKYLNNKEIEDGFSLQYHLRNVDMIFRRVGIL